MAGFARRGELDQLAIFMSSVTDPYQGLERRWRLARGCLDIFLEYPPGLLIVQTRSPFVADDFVRLRQLGSRCWLNFTLETDRDEVRAAITPRCPSVPQRLRTLDAAQAGGLNVQITVSPCLPYSSVEDFGRLLMAHGRRVIVDSYASGDGQGGRRTARTEIPARYAELGWDEWQGEEAARALYGWLAAHMGERAGWSQAGFAQLAHAIHSAESET
jgi:DNA repair photolyase